MLLCLSLVALVVGVGIILGEGAEGVVEGVELEFNDVFEWFAEG